MCIVIQLTLYVKENIRISCLKFNIGCKLNGTFNLHRILRKLNHISCIQFKRGNCFIQLTFYLKENLSHIISCIKLKKKLCHFKFVREVSLDQMQGCCTLRWNLLKLCRRSSHLQIGEIRVLSLCGITRRVHILYHYRHHSNFYTVLQIFTIVPKKFIASVLIISC